MHVCILNGYSVCMCCMFVRMYACFLFLEEFPGRAAMPTGLSINYKSNQTKNSLAYGYRVQINLYLLNYF